MALFDFLKPKSEPKRLKKRDYAAAGTSRLLSDLVDSNRSADSELYPVIRRLRNRSRELARNNEYVKKYLELMKDNVVGKKGFSLQVKALDPNGALDMEGNQEIEAAFAMWSRVGRCTVDGKMSLTDLQKMVVEGLARDGEVFIIKHRGAAFRDSFALEIIEPDQVDEQKNENHPNGNQIRMGVELDRFKRPVAYHVLTNHPGDYDYTSIKTGPKHIRIPADRVMHIYMPLRPGQTRGEPWTSASIPALKHLHGFREAAVINARVSASKMGFFSSNTGDAFPADEYEDNIPQIVAEPGTFHQLPDNVTFSSFDPTFPSGEFDDFHKSVLKGVASGLGVSYTSLANDLEATSYSSIRQGALEDRDRYQGLQEFFIEHFMRPVFESWLESAMEMGAVSVPLRQYAKFATAATFRGRAWQWVDPAKEMRAAIEGMKSGILSLQDVAANYGKDTEELLAQIVRDKALMDQFGVSYALEPFAANLSPVPPEGMTDGEV